MLATPGLSPGMQMSDARIPWAIAALALLALGVSEYRASGVRDDQQATNRRLHAIEQQISASDLHGVAEGREHDLSSAFSASRRPAINAGFPASGMPPPAPISAQESARLQGQALNRLEARFGSDGVDPRWGPATEAQVNEAVADPALAAFEGPVASDIRCMRSVCRMVFTFDSMSQADDWLSFFPVGLATILPRVESVQVMRPDGGVDLRMFGFKK